jgi:general secretion pathway protein I
MMSTLISKAPSSTSGFSLLEVMVAVAIMAMALVAALGSQSQSVSLASEAKFATTSAFLAQKKMAELETMDPGDLVSDSGDFGEDFPGYQWNTDISEDTETQTRWKAEVGYVSNGETPTSSGHVKIIDLTVFWEDQDRYKYGLIYHRFVQDENE